MFVEDLEGTEVVVTGATGFIGSHLTKALVDRGARVSVLVRRGGRLSGLQGVLDKIRIFETDITNASRLTELFQQIQPKKLFHLAAYTAPVRDLANASDALGVNLIGTMALLQAAQSVELDAVVVSGTCEEYGDGEAPYHEDSHVQPVSPYSVTKAAASLWCRMLHQISGLPIVLIRPFLCYGPAQEPNRLVSQAIIAALANQDLPMSPGNQTRDLTHVTDLVQGYIAASITPEAIGQVINLGSGQEHRVQEIVEMIYRLAGSSGKPQPGKLPYRAAEVWRCFTSLNKAKSLLKWQPTIGLEEGLVQTIEWYRENWPIEPSRKKIDNPECRDCGDNAGVSPRSRYGADGELQVRQRPLRLLQDDRGWFVKTLMREHLPLHPEFGEIYVVMAKPGQVRANHYHRVATEWFSVVHGKARLVVHNLFNGEQREFELSAEDPSTVEIPPYYAHAVENRDSEKDFVMLVYTDQPYDRETPDEVAFEVIKADAGKDPCSGSV
jgi:nucleoside-diphosphate-sugar epimerase/dTDP-4-dehydrorhamnose 3,5-epimerase-like enzyme